MNSSVIPGWASGILGSLEVLLVSCCHPVSLFIILKRTPECGYQPPLHVAKMGQWRSCVQSLPWKCHGALIADGPFPESPPQPSAYQKMRISTDAESGKKGSHVACCYMRDELRVAPGGPDSPRATI